MAGANHRRCASKGNEKMTNILTEQQTQAANLDTRGGCRCENCTCKSCGC